MRVPTRDRDPFTAAQGALKTLKLEYLEHLRSMYQQVMANSDDEEAVADAKRKIAVVASQKKLMGTAPLDELFPGAPHDPKTSAPRLA